jgi:hypothetical protein
MLTGLLKEGSKKEQAPQQHVASSSASMREVQKTKKSLKKARFRLRRSVSEDVESGSVNCNRPGSGF